MTWDRAVNGAPDLNTARGAAMQIAGGQATNPYYGDQYTQNLIANNANLMAQSAARGSMAQTDALATRAGSYGGSGWQEQQALNQAALAQAVGQMANQTQQQQQQYSGNMYNQDIQNRLNAAQLSGGLSGEDWTSINNLGQAGNAQQQYQQSLLTNMQNQFQQQQAYPYSQLDWLAGKIGQSAGQYGTNYQQVPGASPYTSAAGLGLLGYSLFGK
jgi:hypothetical protein